MFCEHLEHTSLAAGQREVTPVPARLAMRGVEDEGAELDRPRCRPGPAKRAAEASRDLALPHARMHDLVGAAVEELGRRRGRRRPSDDEVGRVSTADPGEELTVDECRVEADRMDAAGASPQLSVGCPFDRANETAVDRDSIEGAG